MGIRIVGVVVVTGVEVNLGKLVFCVGIVGLLEEFSECFFFGLGIRNIEIRR